MVTFGFLGILLESGGWIRNPIFGDSRGGCSFAMHRTTMKKNSGLFGKNLVLFGKKVKRKEKKRVWGRGRGRGKNGWRAGKENRKSNLVARGWSGTTGPFPFTLHSPLSCHSRPFRSRAYALLLLLFFTFPINLFFKFNYFYL